MDSADVLAVGLRPTGIEALAGKIERELAEAREVQVAALLMLQRIRAVLQLPPDDPEDPADEARTLANLRRLIRINPDRDTLSKLMTTASKALEAMERRALTPAVIGKALLAPEQPAGARIAEEFLSKMDVPTTLKLRQWALEVQQEQRRRAEITAAAV